MTKEAQTSNSSNERSWKQRVIAGTVGVLALAGIAYGVSHSVEAAPCDPVIDNGCVPGGPGSTLPTLPEKGPETTVPETTTTTGVVVTTVPNVTVTTMNVPPAPTVPPVIHVAPHTS